MRRVLVFSLLLGGLLLAACGSGAATEAPQADSASGSSGGPVEDYAGLVEALRAEGATVEPAGGISQDFFSVEGQVIAVNGADVQVFEYASSEEADAEAGTISEDGSSVGTTMIAWIEPPHFYRAGKLIVLYVGSEAGVMDLLEAALGPQFAGR